MDPRFHRDDGEGRHSRTSSVIPALLPVIPAEAGIHLYYQSWTLAFARVTRENVIPALLPVIPAEAGIHLYYQSWTLAFTRVTRGRHFAFQV